MFKSRRNRDRVYSSGVTCHSSIAVPEMPLSYKWTGARNMVTPTALITPAVNSSKKDSGRRP